MWVFINDAFLSIVAHRTKRDHLLVRSRQRQDIVNVFPDAKISHTPKADYAYRAIIKREEVEKAMVAEIRRIDYDNFKNSVADEDRHDAYFEVWRTMRKELV